MKLSTPMIWCVVYTRGSVSLCFLLYAAVVKGVFQLGLIGILILVEFNYLGFKAVFERFLYVEKPIEHD